MVAVTAQGLDPLLADRVVAELGYGKPAAKLDVALIEQAPKPQGGGLLHPGEVILLMGEPGELARGDDSAGEGFEKELADRHDSCNGT